MWLFTCIVDYMNGFKEIDNICVDILVLLYIQYTWRGSDTYPLPFDKDFKPKTAAFYIENTFLNNSKDLGAV